MGEDEVTQNLTFRFSNFFAASGGEDHVPKACSMCGQVFMTNGILDVHWQKVHQAPSLMNCLDCDAEFRRKMGKSRLRAIIQVSKFLHSTMSQLEALKFPVHYLEH